jgi:hypothetical protein
VGLSEDAIIYARLHGWNAATEAALQGDHRYRVTEHRETARENIIILEYQPEVPKFQRVGIVGRAIGGDQGDIPTSRLARAC